jgi:hypothetical protein
MGVLNAYKEYYHKFVELNFHLELSSDEKFTKFSYKDHNYNYVVQEIVDSNVQLLNIYL